MPIVQLIYSQHTDFSGQIGCKILIRKHGRVHPVNPLFIKRVYIQFIGFLINPPIALYYMQGLNTTPVHAHAALVGVYGLLSLGLVLMVLRRLNPGRVARIAASSGLLVN